VRQLVAYCAEHDRPTRPTDIGRADIEAFISYPLDTRLSSTPATRYRGLQQWFRWLEDEEEIDRSPMAKMQPPSVSEKRVRVADVDDLRALLKACNGRHFTKRRDMALIRFMVDTGARLAETAYLRVTDVELDRRAGAVAVVVGKAAASVRCHSAARRCGTWTATCVCVRGIPCRIWNGYGWVAAAVSVG